MSGFGDNSVGAEQLLLLIQRIENLEEEKQNIADDIRDVYVEVKSHGYDTKTVRKLVALRKMDKQKRAEAQMLLETYASAIGLDFI